MADRIVVIVDYGMGNLFSIAKAIEHIGAVPLVTNDLKKIISAERLILPGVGAFGEGIRILSENGLAESILEYLKKGRPLLGICLGMQLLMSESSEFGTHKGLGLIKGKVVRFKDPNGKLSFKIPQIGWNTLKTSERPEANRSWNGTILSGLNENTFFYFIHSFICVPDFSKYVVAESEYGRDVFCSVFNKDNIWGCQFHPERSADAGLYLLKNFVFYQ